jgi:hypothetical protein
MYSKHGCQVGLDLNKSHLTDEPTVRCYGRKRQSQRRRSENSDTKDYADTGRRGQVNNESIRYSFYKALYLNNSIKYQVFLGKNTFFVANQANIPCVASEDLAALNSEYKAINEESKSIQTELKTANSGKMHYFLQAKGAYTHLILVELAQIRGTPTDADLQVRISEVEKAVTSSFPEQIRICILFSLLARSRHV